MNPTEILALRKALGLSQVEFGQVLGAHFMTVSKWERPDTNAKPTPYQVALMSQFAKADAVKNEQEKTELKNLLIGAGVVAALIWLLTATKQ
jgi:transcriptional regulator with XRE-family HTH domain